MPRQLPVGTSDFREIRRPEHRSKTYYIDKTPLIDAIVAEKTTQTLLITRPVRFMKTTNLSMLRYFFDIQDAEENRALFEGLAIQTNPQYQETWQHQGKYPVIYLSLKNVKGENWDDLYQDLLDQIKEMYAKHRVLANSLHLTDDQKEQYTAIVTENASALSGVIEQNQRQKDTKMFNLYKKSLRTLTQFLHQHYQQQVIILIDEYDTPLHTAYQYTPSQYRDLSTEAFTNLDEDKQQKCHFHKTREWLKTFLDTALKDNPLVCRAMMTGVLRTAFASLVSSLNNISIHSVLSPKFADYFGITHEELSTMLYELGLREQLETVKQQIEYWYNGYEMGHTPDGNRRTRLFNPWSIANYLNRCLEFPDYTQPQDYWLQISDSSVIGDYGRKFFNRIEKQLVQLIEQNEIEVNISERTVFSDLEQGNVSAFWGLLLHTGYLTVRALSYGQTGNHRCTVAIPNQEVSGAYMMFIKRWYHNANLKYRFQFDQMLTSLLEGDLTYFKMALEQYVLSAVSYFDIPRKAKSKKRKRGEKNKALQEEDIIATPEQMYHLFILGFVAGLHGDYYQVQSNRESGYGRYDLLLTPRNPKQHGIIFEFKAAEKPELLEEYANVALSQIRKNRYQAALEAYGVKEGLHIGIAFCGKRLHIVEESCTYSPTAEFHLPPSPYSPPTSPTQTLSLPHSGSPEKKHPIVKQKTILPGRLPNGDIVHFKIHPTRGDGNCGFYALPIAGDRQGVRDLLLANAQDASIRALVAPEIRDVVISGHLPHNIPDKAFYHDWQKVDAALQQYACSQDIINQHFQKLKEYTESQIAFENFVRYDVGVKARLAYYTHEENTSVMDAIARLAKLRIHIYQFNRETNQLELKTVRGEDNAIPVYLHHHQGVDTHFELMSITNASPQISYQQNPNTPSGSSTTFFAAPPSSQQPAVVLATTAIDTATPMQVDTDEKNNPE